MKLRATGGAMQRHHASQAPCDARVMLRPSTAFACSHRLKAMGCGASAERYVPCAKDGPKEWQRPATWPAPKEVPPPGPDAPHVVLSTKFEEPWGTISRGLKEILEELGCTVYNPNTDNKELGQTTHIHPRLFFSSCTIDF